LRIIKVSIEQKQNKISDFPPSWRSAHPHDLPESDEQESVFRRAVPG
jgi:hypothetical protein